MGMFKERIKAQFKSKKGDPSYLKLGKNVMAGGCAGTVSLCFVYSLDYARTRLANDVKSVKKGGGTAERQYSGLFDVYKQTLKTDGIGGLYRGFVISAVGIFVYRGCYFGLFDTIRRRMMMTSGQAVKYSGSLDCTMQILKNEGIPSFFKGAGTNILRGMAGAGTLAGFDEFKKAYISYMYPQTD